VERKVGLTLTPFLSRGVGISRDRGAEVLRLRLRPELLQRFDID
jgi:hypothetical protein